MEILFSKAKAIRKELFGNIHYHNMEYLTLEQFGLTGPDISTIDLSKLTRREIRRVIENVESAIHRLDGKQMMIIEEKEKTIKDRIKNDEMIKKSIFRYAFDIDKKELRDNYIEKIINFYETKSSEEKFIFSFLLEKLILKVSDESLQEFVSGCCLCQEINEKLGASDFIYGKLNHVVQKKFQKNA